MASTMQPSGHTTPTRTMTRTDVATTTEVACDEGDQRREGVEGSGVEGVPRREVETPDAQRGDGAVVEAPLRRCEVEDRVGPLWDHLGGGQMRRTDREEHGECRHRHGRDGRPPHGVEAAPERLREDRGRSGHLARGRPRRRGTGTSAPRPAAATRSTTVPRMTGRMPQRRPTSGASTAVTASVVVDSSGASASAASGRRRSSTPAPTPGGRAVRS